MYRTKLVDSVTRLQLLADPVNTCQPTITEPIALIRISFVRKHEYMYYVRVFWGFLEPPRPPYFQHLEHEFFCLGRLESSGQ